MITTFRRLIDNNMTVQNASDLVDAFEVMLKSHGINIAPGSELEQILLTIYEQKKAQEHPEELKIYLGLEGANNFRQGQQEVVGVVALMDALLRISALPCFKEQFVPHLELLNTSNPAQNVARLTDHDAAKIFELYTAAHCATFGTDLVLENPSKPGKNSNPDVLLTFKGHRFGIACKTVFGTSPISLGKNIEKGIDQIEKSEAQTGFVLVNFKNRISHNEFMPIMNEDALTADKGEPKYGVIKNLTDAVDRLDLITTGYRDELVSANGEKELAKLYAGKTATPLLLLFFMTAICKKAPGSGPYTTLLTALKEKEFASYNGYSRDFVSSFAASIADTLSAC